MAVTNKASTATSSSSKLAQIQKLEKAILDSLSNPNPLLKLLALARDDSPEVVHRSIWALHRVFIALINEKRVATISGNESTDTNSQADQNGHDEAKEDEEAQSLTAGWEVKVWVKERLLEYVRVLGGLLRDREEALRVSRNSASSRH
jgi:U3 small nucleolar RNA-associated protein 19